MPKFTIALPQERDDIMATAKKLPSGSWRFLVYDYTDNTGKRHYKSFTSDNPGPKRKREAEFKAAQYAESKRTKNTSYTDYTFKDAAQKYHPILMQYFRHKLMILTKLCCRNK